MLYIVLILVVAALGLLVAALITANSLWAWISIGLSVLAALILLIDWFRRRRSRAAAAEADESVEDAEDAANEVSDEDATLAPAGEALDTGTDSEEQVSESPAEQTTMMPAAGDLAGASVAGASGTDSDRDSGTDSASETDSEHDEHGDPLQERTDPADLRVVSRLDAEVLVVDEYPRYHLDDCGWLGERETIPLAVSEARELGFSPCARCGPDTKLAAQYGGKRSKRKSRSQR